MIRTKLIMALFLVLCCDEPSRAGFFTHMDISGQANFTWSGVDVIPDPGEPTTVHLPGAPTGATTLGGIPFDIRSNGDGKQAWAAATSAAGGDSVVSITLSVNVFGVTDVYTLINTWWGQTGTNASLVFTGSDGANYTKDLYGDVDIRDYNQTIWTNVVNGTTTTEVFTGISNWGVAGRLDMQHIVLPAEFASQTLVSIQLIDSGRNRFQRTVLNGLTVFGDVQPVPEPASLSLFGLGALGIVGASRRRKLESGMKAG